MKNHCTVAGLSGRTGASLSTVFHGEFCVFFILFTVSVSILFLILFHVFYSAFILFCTIFSLFSCKFRYYFVYVNTNGLRCKCSLSSHFFFLYFLCLQLIQFELFKIVKFFYKSYAPQTYARTSATDNKLYACSISV